MLCVIFELWEGRKKMDSHAAAMIKRFREGKPMSRAERDKYNKGISEMWWIDNPQNQTFSRTDESEQPRNSSPMKPMARHDLWDPIKSPVPARRNESWRRPVTPPRRATTTRRVDDLISDEIEDDFLSQPTFEPQSPSYARPKLRSSYENPVDLLGSLRFSREDRAKPSENKSYRFRTSLRFDDDNRDLDIYRSLEKNRQLTDSVDTFGAIGFKSLLAPDLKLDGKSDLPPPPSTKQEGHELAHLTTNLETLLRSFKVDRADEDDIPLTEYEVPQSISQVTNQLNSDMLTFLSQYSNKYSEEEFLEKQQKQRDSEMMKLGQQEAQMKLMMDTEHYNLYCEELQMVNDLKRNQLGNLSSDEKILQEIEQNIQQRRLLSSERKIPDTEEVDEREEKNNERRSGDDLYRHRLYHRNRNHAISLSELSSNHHLQRTESLYLLHRNFDPRLRPPTSTSVLERGRAYPQQQDPYKYQEEEREEDIMTPLTGIDVLSFHNVNHRSITTAARDTISCCLNATMNTLALRLPGEEEILRQTTLEDEMKEKYLQENEKLNEELNFVKAELLRKEQELLDRIKELNSSPPQGEVLDKPDMIVEESSPSSRSSSRLELVNHVKEEELKKIEELLGPEEKETELLKEVLKKKEMSDEEKLQSSQIRNIYFRSPREIEEKIARRGDDSRKPIQRYVYPSKIASPVETSTPSAPDLPLEQIPSPPSRASSSSRSIDPQTIPRYEREAYLQKMKSMRLKMMTS
jgi:hypothetical protein